MTNDHYTVYEIEWSEWKNEYVYTIIDTSDFFDEALEIYFLAIRDDYMCSYCLIDEYEPDEWVLIHNPLWLTRKDTRQW